MPFVGNGFVATHPIVGSEGGIHAAYNGSQVFMSGVYNGVSKPIGEWGINRQQSHRAALPDWVTNVTAGDGSMKLDSYSVDMQRAIITKSWTASDGALQVKELHMAHQTRRNLLLHVVNVTNHGGGKAALKLEQYPGPSCGAEFTEGGCPQPAAVPGKALEVLLHVDRAAWDRGGAAGLAPCGAATATGGRRVHQTAQAGRG